MRMLWNVVSFLAVVNLLALGLFAGWLASTDRLSLDRVQQVRELLAPTIDEVVAAEADAAAEAEADRAGAAREARRVDPALATNEELRSARLVRRQEAESRRLVEDLVALRRTELEADRQALDAERAAFEAERTAWETATADARQRQADAQFAKAVKLYETSPAKNVKQWLENLVSAGETAQAVAYLDAMNPMASKKVLTLFKSEQESALATELLERLRTLGTTEAPEDRSNDDPAAFAAPTPDSNG